MNNYKVKCKYLEFNKMEDTYLAVDERDAYYMAEKAFFNMNADRLIKGEEVKALISVEVEEL